MAVTASLDCAYCDERRPEVCGTCHHESADLAFRHGMRKGMVVGAALIAWAEVLRRNAPRVVERTYWTSELDGRRLYDCACPGCGVMLSHMTPGEDEGTDNEWCGGCRS